MSTYVDGSGRRRERLPGEFRHSATGIVVKTIGGLIYFAIIMGALKLWEKCRTDPAPQAPES